MNAGELWGEYRTWLAEASPVAYENLAPGASDEALAKLEARIGHGLPEDVKAVLRLNDGQRKTMIATNIVAAPVCLPSLSLLSTELIAAVWDEWEELRKDAAPDVMKDLNAAARSEEAGVVRALYTHPGWIPLWSDPTRADYVGVDLAPDEKGKSGQIINFGRNEERHFPFAGSYTELLGILLEEVRSGRWNASSMPFGEGDEEVPWLGPPRKHFFMALHARWKARQPPTPREQRNALERKVTLAKDARDFEAARAALQEAETKFPDYLTWQVLGARIALEEERFDEAERRYAIVVERSPLSLDHFYARIDNLVDGLRDKARAVALLKARLAEDPEDEVALETLEEIAKKE